MKMAHMINKHNPMFKLRSLGQKEKQLWATSKCINLGKIFKVADERTMTEPTLNQFPVAAGVACQEEI